MKVEAFTPGTRVKIRVETILVSTGPQPDETFTMEATGIVQSFSWEKRSDRLLYVVRSAGINCADNGDPYVCDYIVSSDYVREAS